MLSIGDKVVFCYGRFEVVFGNISEMYNGHLTVLAKKNNRTIEYKIHSSQARLVK